MKNSRWHIKRISIEVIIIGALYSVYTYTRNVSETSPSNAFHNAKKIIRLEEFLSIYIEKDIHKFFLNSEWIIIFANYYYGTLHFIVTIFALLYVFSKDPVRYPKVRNTIVFTTLTALAGFLTFPLMPPRLLPKSYGFVDTLAKYPTFWSFNSKELAAVSNQFAAMPSVHIAWSTWCVFALLPYIKKTWLKVLLYAYPLVTFFVIVVTSNHYILDAVGGWIVLSVGYLVSRMIASLTTRSAIDKTESLAEINAK
ncbi:MAG: phosphatase PAP2 family protein [Acidimicrobiia bacterium]